MGQLRIQHCIANTVTRQYGPHPASDLLGVDFIRTVPANTEFPTTLTKLEVFVRFFTYKLKRCRLNISIIQLPPPGLQHEVVYRQRFDLLALDLFEGRCFDRSVKLVNVFIPGEGDYSIRFTRRIRRPWEYRSRHQVLAVEYFRVQRAT